MLQQGTDLRREFRGYPAVYLDAIGALALAPSALLGGTSCLRWQFLPEVVAAPVGSIAEWADQFLYLLGDISAGPTVNQDKAAGTLAFTPKVLPPGAVRALRRVFRLGLVFNGGHHRAQPGTPVP